MTGTGLRIVLLYATAGCATHMTAVRPLPPEKEAEINDIVESRKSIEANSEAAPTH